MKAKEFPYKQTFSCIIKPMVSEEKDKYLAMASLEEVKSFLPAIDCKANHDLLPVAFNACVVNRVNKNDDVIDTETAIAIYKNFAYKQINLEHNRKNVVGVILTAGFSEFGSDRPLREDEVRGMTGPFNITLGGIVWRVVNGELSDFIEDSNDPTSANYMGVSASWELGFTDYKIVTLPEGQKNIEAGQIIAEDSEISKFKSKLKSLGGDGRTVDDKRIYRMPSEGVLPLGIGFTERPAADVEGVATEVESKIEAKKDVESEAIDKLESIDKAVETSSNPQTVASEDIKQKNISQATNSNVNIDIIKIMKITSIKDITDESLKQTNASAIAEFISSELTDKSKVWEAEKGKLDKQLSEAAEAHTNLTKEHEKLQAALKTLQATVDSLNAEKVEREKVEKFNARMSEINEAYELDDEVRAALVEEVKALAADEDFDKWKKKASVLLKGFAKKAKADDEEDVEAKKAGFEKKDKEDKKKEKSSDTKAAVENALDNADKEKGGLPNSTSTATPSLKEKYQSAFAKESFEIKY